MKPIVIFDLETTGTEVETSKIVELACLKVSHDLQPIEDQTVKRILVNPGIPIPPEVTEIHKITNEMVADAGTFGRYANGIYQYFAGCDVAGFNSNRFDVPLLAEEFARVGILWPEPGTYFIDVYQIFATKEPRDLGNAVRFYCGREHENAHSAEADILATAAVLAAQIVKYPELAGKSAKEIHEFCQGENPWVDLAGKIVLKDGQAVYGFGKDKFKPVAKNPGFAHWMLKQSFPTNTKNVLKKILGYGK
jgi:DNA polymerase III subunit epsilon